MGGKVTFVCRWMMGFVVSGVIPQSHEDNGVSECLL